MHEILYNYDIYPKVFLGDREQTVTIEPLGDHANGVPGFEYHIEVRKISNANPESYPERSGRTHLKKRVDADGCLRITAYFEGEGEHYIFLRQEEGGRSLLTFSVCTRIWQDAFRSEGIYTCIPAARMPRNRRRLWRHITVDTAMTFWR